jgi:hypothetical protein
VHDPVTNKFYWIGGIQANRKSNSVVVFSMEEPDKEKRWAQCRLKVARSSCMAALIKAHDRTGKSIRGILIVGGIGENG